MLMGDFQGVILQDNRFLGTSRIHLAGKLSTEEYDGIISLGFFHSFYRAPMDHREKAWEVPLMFCGMDIRTDAVM